MLVSTNFWCCCSWNHKMLKPRFNSWRYYWTIARNLGTRFHNLTVAANAPPKVLFFHCLISLFNDLLGTLLQIWIFKKTVFDMRFLFPRETKTFILHLKHMVLILRQVLSLKSKCRQFLKLDLKQFNGTLFEYSLSNIVKQIECQLVVWFK